MKFVDCGVRFGAAVRIVQSPYAERGTIRWLPWGDILIHPDDALALEFEVESMNIKLDLVEKGVQTEGAQSRWRARKKQRWPGSEIQYF